MELAPLSSPHKTPTPGGILHGYGHIYLSPFPLFGAPAFHKQIDQDLEDLRYGIQTTLDESQGRVGERPYCVIKIPIDFCSREEWPWLTAIGYSVRISQQANRTETTETRFDILNRRLSCKRFSEAVRGHWGVDSMPWVLAVNFREDDSRTCERTLGNNLSWLRRFAVTLVKRHLIKDSQRGKMINCMMNPDCLTEVLPGSSFVHALALICPQCRHSPA